MRKITSLAVVSVFGLLGCSQEVQNQVGRQIQNWTGTDGVLDIYAGDKLVNRFIKIDKLSTAYATNDSSTPRPYRYGYGYLDRNLNYQVDEGEKRVYFEFSDYSTSYVFYENPGLASPVVNPTENPSVNPSVNPNKNPPLNPNLSPTQPKPDN